MTTRTATRLAWSLWGLAMALEVAGILLWLPNHAVLVDRFGATEDFAPQVFLVPGYTTVGAVIAARSRNRIGWLLLAFGLVAALMVFAGPYNDRGVVIAPGSLPAAAMVGRLGAVGWPASFLFLGLLLLVFPDGRLPSARWRLVSLVFVGSWGLLLLYDLFEPATETLYDVEKTKPLAIQALGHPAAKAVYRGCPSCGPGLAGRRGAGPAAALPPRRAGATPTAQMVRVRGRRVLRERAGRVAVATCATHRLGALTVAVVVGVLVGLPLAIGVAILRYRLYDIDRLISRALVYAILTVVLGLGYDGLVLALGQLFGTSGSAPPAGRWPPPP